MVNHHKFICGILGYPLKKPRSIPIWKNYFSKNNINSSMEKFEIENKKLDSFMSSIKQNRKFLAMAITMPYKKKILKYASKLDDFAKKSGSINLLIKNKKKLLGFNTDVYGAIETIKYQIKKYNKIIIFGLGGTGSALFNYMKKTYPQKDYIIITSKKKIVKSRKVKFKKIISKDLLREKSLIVNCTPLGSNLKKIYKNKTPIKKKMFPYINKSSFVFDIIYSPKKTLLLKYSQKFKINCTNGIKMNTMQAQKALQFVFKK